MGNDQQLRETRLVFYRDDLVKIDKLLEKFVELSKAKSVLLVDKEGHMITRAGEDPSFDADTISALVAGSFSATREMARLLGEDEFSALYHQGENDNIQLSMVGDRTILTVLFDDSTTLGMVRLYVNETVEKLEVLFAEVEAKRASGEGEEEGFEDEEFQDSASDALDAFFDEPEDAS